ncbi:MAG: hypothetical protein JNM84_01705 [Planctomycetes bacterium]|nr:hypothetical protein [Planctomycetota bacterium]
MITMRSSALAAALVLVSGHGEAQGTASLLLDIRPGASSSNVNAMIGGDDAVYFLATTGCSPSCTGGLFRSDGTTAGTYQVSFPGQTGTPRSPLLYHQGRLFFGGATAATGQELFVAVGGTATLVRDIAPGTASSSYRDLTAGPGGVIYFFAQEASSGLELWRTDGTPSGTLLVKDIQPGPTSGIRNPLTPNGKYLVPYEGHVYFEATDGMSGYELWRSDGTNAGTVRVADLQSGSGSSSPQHLTSANGLLYFTATTTAAGHEPYAFDGTSVISLGDLYVGTNGSIPIPGSGGTSFVEANGTVFFTARNSTNGYELWKTDGTASGTSEVIDLFPGFDGSFPGSFANLGDLLLFQAEDDGSFGRYPFRSDGTAAGTTRLSSTLIQTGQIFALQGAQRAVFTSGSLSTQLYRTDGTSAGTVLHQTLRAGGSSQPGSYLAWRDKIFFTADNGATGLEPWVMSSMAYSQPFGFGCAGTGGLVPRIESGAAPTLGNSSFRIELDRALPFAPAFLGMGFVPFDFAIGGGCSLYFLPPPFPFFPTTTDANGEAAITIPIPNLFLYEGLVMDTQYFVVDPLGALSGLALSGGLRTVLQFQ